MGRRKEEEEEQELNLEELNLDFGTEWERHFQGHSHLFPLLAWDPVMWLHCVI